MNLLITSLPPCLPTTTCPPVRPQAEILLAEGDAHDGKGDERDGDEGLPQPAREQGDGLLLHDPGPDGVAHDCACGGH